MAGSSSVELIDLTSEEAEGDEPEIISEYFIGMDFTTLNDDEYVLSSDSDTTTPGFQEDDAESGSTLAMTLSPVPPMSPNFVHLQNDLDVLSDGDATVAAVEEVNSSSLGPPDIGDLPIHILGVSSPTSASPRNVSEVLMPAESNPNSDSDVQPPRVLSERMEELERSGLQLIGEAQFPPITFRDIRAPVFDRFPFVPSIGAGGSRERNTVASSNRPVIRSSLRLQMRRARTQAIPRMSSFVPHQPSFSTKASSSPVPNDVQPTVTPPIVTEISTLPLCPICQDRLPEIRASRRTLLSTLCGHLFCSRCLPIFCSTKPVNGLNCPVCSQRISKRLPYHPIYW